MQSQDKPDIPSDRLAILAAGKPTLPVNLKPSVGFVKIMIAMVWKANLGEETFVTPLILDSYSKVPS